MILLLGNVLQIFREIEKHKIAMTVLSGQAALDELERCYFKPPTKLKNVYFVELSLNNSTYQRDIGVWDYADTFEKALTDAYKRLQKHSEVRKIVI